MSSHPPTHPPHPHPHLQGKNHSPPLARALPSFIKPSPLNPYILTTPTPQGGDLPHPHPPPPCREKPEPPFGKGPLIYVNCRPPPALPPSLSPQKPHRVTGMPSHPPHHLTLTSSKEPELPFDKSPPHTSSALPPPTHTHAPLTSSNPNPHRVPTCPSSQRQRRHCSRQTPSTSSV